MAAVVAPRQPFAALSNCRGRNLRSVKNTHKSVPELPACKATKRSYATEFPDDSNKSDEENTNPNVLFSSKRSKLTNPSTTQPCKPTLKALLQPSSTQTAKAGTFPQNLQKTFLKRAMPSAKPRQFSEQKSLPTGAITPRPALARSVSDPTMPKSWFFEIHEDTEEEYLTNMMDHAATNLDISDDEGKKSDKYDNDDKENIPPPGCSVPSRSSGVLSRKRVFDDQDDGPTSKKRRANPVTGTRVVMGELKTADFYTEEDVAAAESSDSVVQKDDHAALDKAKFEFKPQLAHVKRPIKSFTRRSTLQAKMKTSSPLQMEFPSIETTLAKSISEAVAEGKVEDAPVPVIEKSDEEIKIWESDHEDEVEAKVLASVSVTEIAVAPVEILVI